MIKIRYTRVRKYSQKNESFILITKMVVIFYLTTFLSGYLISDTGAYFNDNSRVSGTIQAGTWENEWDKSSLKFTGNDQAFESCNQKKITVTLTNTGSDMKGPSQYEVYYIDKGNPKDGEKVADGVIEPILANKSVSLKYTTTKPGNYKFRAFQRPNHAFNAERQDLWSETITITCKNKSANETQPNQINNNQGEQTENINENDNKSIKPEDSETNQNEKIDSSQNEKIDSSQNETKPEGTDTNQTGDSVPSQNETKPEGTDTKQTDDSVPSQNDPKPEGADTNQSGKIDSSKNDTNSTVIDLEMGIKSQ